MMKHLIITIIFCFLKNVNTRTDLPLQDCVCTANFSPPCLMLMLCLDPKMQLLLTGFEFHANNIFFYLKASEILLHILEFVLCMYYVAEY